MENPNPGNNSCCHHPDIAYQYGVRLLCTSTHGSVSPEGGRTTIAEKRMVEPRALLRVQCGRSPTWELSPEKSKIGKKEPNSGDASPGTTKSKGDGGGTASGKRVALPGSIGTLIAQRSFSKSRLSLSYIAIEEGKLDSAHPVVKYIFRDIEENALIDCGVSEVVFIDENFVLHHYLPLHKLKVPRTVEVIDGRPID